MHERLKETRGHFISSMRVRKVLIPVEDQNSVRCVTIAADGPEPGDKVLANQIAFDDELIRLGLMKRRSLLQKGFNLLWVNELDRVRPKDRPLETLLRYVD